MVALIGPSGSGRSTLLRNLSALIKPDKTNNRIQVFDKVIQENGKIAPDIRQIRAKMGALNLRLPNSIHRHIKEIAQKEGISINSFINSAVSEKISALLPKNTF